MPPVALVVQLDDCRSRSLHLDLYGPATFSCTLDGRSQAAIDLVDLAQDVVVYHWDSVFNVYRVLFRGPVSVAQDQLSDTTHTVNLQCADYRAMLNRRFQSSSGNVGPPFGAPPTGPPVGSWATTDQCDMVHSLLTMQGGPGTKSDLGVYYAGARNPDGSYIGQTTTVWRNRMVYGGELVADWIDNLAACQNGFDWAVLPVDPAADTSKVADVWVYYPQRGVTQPKILEWGVNVSGLSRTTSTANFANLVRCSGASLAPLNVPDQPATTAPIFQSAQVPGASVGSEGFWWENINYPDVQVQSQLSEYANGRLALDSNPQPAYTLDLIAGTWHSAYDFDLGDSLELRVNSGRLNVRDTVRIVAFDFAIDDDGSDKLTLSVARPTTDFASDFQGHGSLLDALSRR